MSHRPSGDQAGDEWYWGQRVSSVATPVLGSTLQIEPLIAMAMDVPSGDHAGALGVLLGAGGR